MDFWDQYQEDMVSYVQDMLSRYDPAIPRIRKIGYSRFEHTMRVFKWMKRLYAADPNKEMIDLEALSIAALFHDVGYCNMESEKKHAEISAGYCREYLQDKKYSPERTEFICDIISRHSDKSAIHEDIPKELILLLEADLLDDTGALGLVMDIWLEAVCEEKVTYQSILKHMEKFTLTTMQENPMRTEEGRKIWDEKKKLTEAFVHAFREDFSI